MSVDLKKEIQSLVGDKEIDCQIIESLNRTNREFPKDKTIVELFEEVVEKNPTKTAVVYEGQEISYEELNERANAVAYWLRDQGIGRDDGVAIKTDRSLETISGISRNH